MKRSVHLWGSAFNSEATCVGDSLVMVERYYRGGLDGGAGSLTCSLGAYSISALNFQILLSRTRTTISTI